MLMNLNQSSRGSVGVVELDWSLRLLLYIYQRHSSVHGSCISNRNHSRIEDLDTFLYSSTILVCINITRYLWFFFCQLVSNWRFFWHRNAHGFIYEDCCYELFFVCFFCVTAYCKELGDEDVMLETVTFSWWYAGDCNLELYTGSSCLSTRF